MADAVYVKVPQADGEVTLSDGITSKTWPVTNGLIEAADEREAARLKLYVAGAEDPSPQQQAAKTRARNRTASPSKPSADTADGEEPSTPEAPADPQE